MTQRSKPSAPDVLRFVVTLVHDNAALNCTRQLLLNPRLQQQEFGSHISMRRLDDTLCHAPMAVNKSDNRARGHQSPTPNTNQCSETPNIEPAFDQLRCMTSDDGNDININAVNKYCVKILYAMAARTWCRFASVQHSRDTRAFT